MELLAIERLCSALAVSSIEVNGIFRVLSTFWNQVTSLHFYIRIFKRTLAPWLCQVRAWICYSFLCSFEDTFIFFFHYLLSSVSGEISQWQSIHHRTKDIRSIYPLYNCASQFCYFLALSFNFSYLLMYSNLTCHCMFIKHSVHHLNCPLLWSNSQILKIIILEPAFRYNVI